MSKRLLKAALKKGDKIKIRGGKNFYTRKNIPDKAFNGWAKGYIIVMQTFP